MTGTMYILDPKYKGEAYPSLSCKCKRGVSYPPPGGWKRKYKINIKNALKPTAKKNNNNKNLDCLFSYDQLQL